MWKIQYLALKNNDLFVQFWESTRKWDRVKDIAKLSWW